MEERGLRSGLSAWGLVSERLGAVSIAAGTLACYLHFSASHRALGWWDLVRSYGAAEQPALLLSALARHLAPIPSPLYLDLLLSRRCLGPLARLAELALVVSAGGTAHELVGYGLAHALVGTLREALLLEHGTALAAWWSLAGLAGKLWGLSLATAANLPLGLALAWACESIALSCKYSRASVRGTSSLPPGLSPRPVASYAPLRGLPAAIGRLRGQALTMLPWLPYLSGATSCLVEWAVGVFPHRHLAHRVRASSVSVDGRRPGEPSVARLTAVAWSGAAMVLAGAWVLYRLERWGWGDALELAGYLLTLRQVWEQAWVWGYAWRNLRGAPGSRRLEAGELATLLRSQTALD